MNLELTGKTALVTGGSQGIGRAIALGLSAEGARVAICARDKARLEQTAHEIKTKTNADVLIVPGDLSRLDEVNRVAATVKERLGRIDILVNNAGAIRGGDFLKIPDEQWAGDWSLKILGYVRMARAVFPMMQAQGGGRIINVVGAAARNPTPVYLTGGIANSGLINFSKGLADLGAASNILVNAVSPAATATARWETLIEQQAATAGKSVEAQRAEVEGQYPLKRIATPEDCARAIVACATHLTYATGARIVVDGGRSL